MSIVEERYSKWLNHENLAPQYKPVLEAMNACLLYTSDAADDN